MMGGESDKRRCCTLGVGEGRTMRPAGSTGGEHYALFDTPIGTFGIAWSAQGVKRLQLPESELSATERRLRAKGSGSNGQGPPPEIERVIAEIRRYVAGE